MATKSKKKSNKKTTLAQRIAPWAAAVLGALLALVLLVGAINARTIRVRRAEVTLADLPSAFDGKTLLYASDIDLCGWNTPERAADLFRRLRALNPDAVLLGGDYNSESLFSVLNRRPGSEGMSEGAREARWAFLASLADFDAPLGKYAIRSAEDAEPDNLASAMANAGIRPLFDDAVTLTLGGDSLRLVGLTDEHTAAKAAHFAHRDDCVIALAASPALIPGIMISEAEGGGAWCDLVLAGHTHGGQVRLGSLNALTLNEAERHYLSGWKKENGVRILTTTGVGCEGLNLRLGSRPEVWVVELRKGK